jgi:drug/metabolite transporter (DMT)-like permease
MARIWNYLALIVAAICFGTIPIFSTYLTDFFGVPSLQQALFRVLFTVIFLFIGLGVFTSYRSLKLKREHIPSFLVYGLIGIATSIIAYITAIAIGTPVVIAVSLTYLYPAITLLLARYMLKEPFNRVRLIAVPLSIAGAVIVSLPLEITASPVPVVGILLAVANGVFAAFYVILGRKWGGYEGYNPSTTTFWGYFFALLWMGPLILTLNLVVVDPLVSGFLFILPPEAWLLLLGFAFVSTTIPYTLVNVGVKNIDASAASILLLLDPISAVVMAYFFLGQSVAFWQFIGAFLILLATVLIAIEPRLVASSKNLL